MIYRFRLENTQLKKKKNIFEEVKIEEVKYEPPVLYHCSIPNEVLMAHTEWLKYAVHKERCEG